MTATPAAATSISGQAAARKAGPSARESPSPSSARSAATWDVGLPFGCSMTDMRRSTARAPITIRRAIAASRASARSDARSAMRLSISFDDAVRMATGVRERGGLPGGECSAVATELLVDRALRRDQPRNHNAQQVEAKHRSREDCLRDHVSGRRNHSRHDEDDEDRVFEMPPEKSGSDE